MNHDLLTTKEWVNANTSAVLGAQSCHAICSLGYYPLETEFEVREALEYFLRAGEILNALDQQ